MFIAMYSCEKCFKKHTFFYVLLLDINIYIGAEKDNFIGVDRYPNSKPNSSALWNYIKIFMGVFTKPRVHSINGFRKLYEIWHAINQLIFDSNMIFFCIWQASILAYRFNRFVKKCFHLGQNGAGWYPEKDVTLFGSNDLTKPFGPQWHTLRFYVHSKTFTWRIICMENIH